MKSDNSKHSNEDSSDEGEGTWFRVSTPKGLKMWSRVLPNGKVDIRTTMSPPQYLKEMRMRAGIPKNTLMLLWSRLLAIRLMSRKARARSIELPPLMTLDRIVRFLWSAKTYSRVFEPARADLVDEWQRAFVAGETQHAWYIKHVLGRLIMLNHIAVQLPSSILKFLAKFFEISK